MAFDFGPALATTDHIFGERIRYTPLSGSMSEFQAVIRSPDENADIGRARQTRAWQAEIRFAVRQSIVTGDAILRLGPRAGEPASFKVKGFRASESGDLWFVDLEVQA